MPMPKDASGQGDILCGRIRTDVSDPSGKSFCMFVAGRSVAQRARLLRRGSDCGLAIFGIMGSRMQRTFDAAKSMLRSRFPADREMPSKWRALDREHRATAGNA